MMRLISKFGLLIIIIVILFLLVTRNFFSSSPLVITGQLLAVVLGIWARLSFHKDQFSIHAEPVEGSLLTTGPYRFIRHPMYASALLLIWSAILGHLSYLTAFAGLIASGVMAVRIKTEEEILLKHNPGYSEYSQKTKRIIPFVF
jgi:protein-S-isoprenylcysteine O-methyltransferase Ste14